MSEVTQQITWTLCWKIADLNQRREDTGMLEVPLSPEMELAQNLLDDLEAGRIECWRKET